MYISIFLTVGCADYQIENTADGIEEKSFFGSTTGSNLVHLRFAGFIPCSAVNVPGIREYPYVGGDNRSFSFEQAAKRSRASASVLIDPYQGITNASGFIGLTRAYKSDQISKGSGLCNTVYDNEVPSRAEQDSLDGIKYHFESYRTFKGHRYNYDKVTLILEAKNPISYLAPHLNAWVSVYVVYEDSSEGLRPVQYLYEGEHDGFPSYELYVNRELAFSYDITRNGSTPFELIGLADKRFERGWSPISIY